MGAHKPATPAKTNALEIRSQWGWQTSSDVRRSRHIAPILISAIIALWILEPFLILNILLWGFSFFILVMACIRILALFITIKNIKPTPQIDTTNNEWPKFTILVPLYHEAHMVDDLVKHLLETNYPHNLLDIVLVVEADDEATCKAAKHNSPPHCVSLKFPLANRAPNPRR